MENPPNDSFLLSARLQCTPVSVTSVTPALHISKGTLVPFIYQVLCIGLGTGPGSAGSASRLAVRLSWLREMPGCNTLTSYVLRRKNTHQNTTETRRIEHCAVAFTARLNYYLG